MHLKLPRQINNSQKTIFFQQLRNFSNFLLVYIYQFLTNKINLPHTLIEGDEKRWHTSVETDSFGVFFRQNLQSFGTGIIKYEKLSQVYKWHWYMKFRIFFIFTSYSSISNFFLSQVTAFVELVVKTILVSDHNKCGLLTHPQHQFLIIPGHSFLADVITSNPISQFSYPGRVYSFLTLQSKFSFLYSKKLIPTRPQPKSLEGIYFFYLHRLKI